MRFSLLAVLGSLALSGCVDPIGSWEVRSESVSSQSLSSAEFERFGEGAATFTLPDGDDPAGAFYRLQINFTRSGTTSEIDENAERVFLRVSPRFESFDGTLEVTTFLIDGTASLLAQGSLAACDESGPCARDIGIFAGWLAPPIDGAELALELELTTIVRGSGDEEPPADAAATASLLF